MQPDYQYILFKTNLLPKPCTPHWGIYQKFYTLNILFVMESRKTIRNLINREKPKPLYTFELLLNPIPIYPGSICPRKC
jgi:hypothetical protein